jgi:NAD(P)-dependent dehydrogenase (short-subunit alcohol dehydrogenase family)
MARAVVTGSGSGIGAATTDQLREDGWDVLGVDLRGAEVAADLAAVDARARALDRALAWCGGSLDAVVACAGVGGFGSRPGSAVVAVNYFGAVAVLDGLRPALAASPTGAGRALAIASNSSTVQPGLSNGLIDACLTSDEAGACRIADDVGALNAYGSSKLALARWVRRQSTTEPWSGAGIRLNAVSPGMVETPLVEEGRSDPAVRPLLEAFPIPLGPAQPDDVAALVVALLGDAGRAMAGSVVLVDGGSEALIRPDGWPAALGDGSFQS